MRLLLDTHTLIWWANDSMRLSLKAKDALLDPEAKPYASAVSAFEIATKHAQGKLPDEAYLAENFDAYALEQSFERLPVSTRQASLAGNLPLHHRDPFDRLLIAQALNLDLILISNEKLFDAYGVKRLW